VVQPFDRFVEVAHEAAAAKFAVGEDLKAQILLPGESAQDVLVLDRSERVGGDMGIAAGIEHCPRPQEAADVVCAVHRGVSLPTYLNAIFDFRSSSALIPGPNSFSKNPSFTSLLTMRL
jgi:hypothetical protein